MSWTDRVGRALSTTAISTPTRAPTRAADVAKQAEAHGWDGLTTVDFQHLSGDPYVFLALAAGAMLTMIVDTMIPEAFAETHDFAGLITVLAYQENGKFDQNEGTIKITRLANYLYHQLEVTKDQRAWKRRPRVRPNN